MSLEFTIPGKPLPLKRHRTTKFKNQWRTHNPSKADQVAWLAQAKQYAPDTPREGALFVTLKFYMPRPRSDYTFEGELKRIAPRKHIKKPDVDNLVKFYLDAMSGVFFKDDRQITTVLAKKLYAKSGEEPRTYVCITQDDDE